MGGKGSYSEVDVDISDPDNPVEKAGGKKGIMKALASLFGMDVVEKGAVKENYQRRIIRDNFWSAFYSLSDYLLETYNPETGRFEPVHDESKIKEALEDFNAIVTDLLASDEGVFKSIEKAGKKMSTKNKETLTAIHENLGEFLSRFKDDDEEEKEAYDEEYDELYSICRQSLYTAGYRIYTSIDMDMQSQLQESVSSQLAMFTDKTDDGIYEVQGAAVCINNDTGRVAAIVGGREADQEGYGLNRAYQSFRQPGSSIKPLLVYAPALEQGYTAYSTLDDSRMTGEDFYWHSLRHYFTTHLSKLGLPDNIIQDIVGWESADMVRVYKDLNAEEQISQYFDENGDIKADVQKSLSDL